MQYIYHKSRHLGLLLILAIVLEGVPLTMAGAQVRDEVRNVSFAMSGKRITIVYDLQGSEDQQYRISVTLKKKKDTTYSYIPLAVEGDVGDGCTIGNKKQIIWSSEKEFLQNLVWDDFYFAVQAERIPEESNTLLYVIGGIVIVGGIVAYLLISNAGETSSTDQGFPTPIGRPVH